MILTTLSDYAKQKGISRARAYQLQSKLSTIDLPVNVSVTYEGRIYQVEAHTGTKVQTFVKQDPVHLQGELDAVNLAIANCNGCNLKRLQAMKKQIEFILK